MNFTITHLCYKEFDREKLLYRQLMEGRISKALDSLQDLQLIALCTEKIFKSSKKFIQAHRIEKFWNEKLLFKLKRTYLPNFLVNICVHSTNFQHF